MTGGPSQPRLATARSRLASLLWLVAVLAALVLAVGALCRALRLDEDNTLVAAVLDGARAVDFGMFKDFEGADARVKEALVNWGVAAVLWLVGGKVLDRLVRP